MSNVIHVDEAVNTTEKGKAPKKKFPTAKAAWHTITKMIENQKTTEATKAKIIGLCDGNPPYSSTELRRLGQAWRSNVNFREAESIIDNNSSAYWELMYDVSSLAIAKLPKYKGSDKVDKENIIAEEFSKMILAWEGFFYEMAIKIDQMLKVGRGVLYWPDANDWRFESCKDGSLLLPKRAKCNIDKLNTFGIRDVKEIADAYVIAEDEDGIYSTLGWNVNNLRKVLVKQFKMQYGESYNNEQYQQGDWLDAQQKIRNGDWDLEEKEFEPLKLVHLFTVESSKKVSHYIMSEMDDGGDKVFLYDGFEELNHMSQALSLFFYHFGDGYANGVKGLGHRVYPHVEISNRLTNGLFDGALLAGSMVLQPATGDSPKNITLARIGPVTVLPAGYTPIQSSFQPPLNHMIAMRAMSQRIMSQNAGIYDVPDPEQGGGSATEARYKAEKEARFSNNQVILFYIQWDRCLREIYRRVLKASTNDYPVTAPGYEEAKAMVDACRERGIDTAMLKDSKVSARRAIGLGSPSMRRQKITRIYQIRGDLPDVGKYNAIRDFVAAEVGYESADRYVGAIGQDQIKDHDDWEILMEENDLHDGYPVMSHSGQNEFKHIRQHLMAIAEVLEISKKQPQNINPEKTAMYLSAALPHIGQHVQSKAGDSAMKNDMKAIEEIFNEAQKLLQSLQQALQQRQQSAQAQQQAMAQQQAQMTPEMMAVRNKAIIDQQKAQSMAESRDIKTQAGIEQSERRLQASIDEQRRVTDAKIEDMFRKAQIKVIEQE